MSQVLHALRGAFRASPLGAVLVPEVIPAEVREVLRERVRPGLEPFHLADRGRYHVNTSHRELEIAAVLAEVASSIVEQPLIAAPDAARWTRLVRGDYALYKDDARRWHGRPEPFELTLDFSVAGSEDAQVVYFDGGSGLVVPQQPGLLALVARRENVQRYDRYLTHRVGEAEVFRVSLPLSIR